VSFVSRIRRGVEVIAGVGAALLMALPVAAAETLFFDYGYLSRSLSVGDLETFAETGEVSSDLESYFRLLEATPQTREQFRQALNGRRQIDVAQLGQLLYTPLGEEFLRQFGTYIQTGARLNGQYAIRAALLGAASNSEGFSLLGVLQQYPTDMRIDIDTTLELAKSLGIVVDATVFFSEAIAQLSLAEAATQGATDFATMTDLTQPGTFAVQQQRWQLRDDSRDRSFYVDVYRPQSLPEGETRVIAISHGLGARPEEYAKRAQHLASYGYLVVLPQHPGSDLTYKEELMRGLHPTTFALEEFVDRPLDVSYVLDELGRRNAAEFGDRLNLQSVGVMGHSFGGYTVMALAGASIDFEHLEESCKNNLEYLDISLFLQCRALELPRQPYNFRDPRVAAVFAINPVNNSIFGDRGLSEIQIPILLAAGTYDPATPAVFEQVRSFRQLTTPNKYLAVLQGQAHVDFSNLDTGVSQMVSSLTSLTLPPPQLLDAYANALTIAFFETELSNNAAFAPYLQATYMEYLSREQPFKAFLISAVSTEGILQASEEFRSQL
jgi:predicted dienelactone hydrolase